jgi:chromosome segregation ATPase
MALKIGSLFATNPAKDLERLEKRLVDHDAAATDRAEKLAQATAALVARLGEGGDSGSEEAAVAALEGAVRQAEGLRAAIVAALESKRTEATKAEKQAKVDALTEEHSKILASVPAQVASVTEGIVSLAEVAGRYEHSTTRLDEIAAALQEFGQERPGKGDKWVTNEPYLSAEKRMAERVGSGLSHRVDLTLRCPVPV